ncbi:hypothetical protein D8674_021197 [Pyrus ussuriensis x Pyrus communis]|uniref:Uncharacterized protein n=1 Tax=Pyrus ussuriensis x Pyrus communis TaxID=2448454 RepID=A0A5N5HHX0_9ROSA|nr:hypothetical protein D8674_021197 [Pyrus ussuriensis x Pyrus communis]
MARLATNLLGNASSKVCLWSKFKGIDGPVDMKRICGTIVATKKGRAGREGKLGNYSQMMNLQFTWEKQWILKRGFNVQKNYKTSSIWNMASHDWKGCCK